MKVKATLSAFLGFLWGFIGYFVLLLFDFDQPFLLALLCGVLYGLLMFLYLVAHGKSVARRYRKFEKEMTSPFFCKANGNFRFGNGNVKNGNIYFCETGIICVCLDKKSYTFDEILLQDIERYQFDNIHLHIFAKDGRVILFSTSDITKIIEILQQKGWIFMSKKAP